MGNQRLKDIIRQQQITIKGLDDAKGALIDYNNNLEAKIAEANKILEELVIPYHIFTSQDDWLVKLRKILANERMDEKK